MAASVYPHPPGSDYGPCIKPCKHKDCERSRVDSEQVCRICNKSIGYGNRVYEENWLDGKRLVHADCLEQEAESKVAYRIGAGEIQTSELKPLSTLEEIHEAYPEHKKFTKITDIQISAVFQFVGHLTKNNIHGAKFIPFDEAEYDNQMYEVNLHNYKLIYATFGIDYDVFMAEKEDMLKQLNMRYKKEKE